MKAAGNESPTKMKCDRGRPPKRWVALNSQRSLMYMVEPKTLFSASLLPEECCLFSRFGETCRHPSVATLLKTGMEPAHCVTSKFQPARNFHLNPTLDPTEATKGWPPGIFLSVLEGRLVHGKWSYWPRSNLGLPHSTRSAVAEKSEKSEKVEKPGPRRALRVLSRHGSRNPKIRFVVEQIQFSTLRDENRNSSAQLEFRFYMSRQGRGQASE